jgi:hypothetical protein
VHRFYEIPYHFYWRDLSTMDFVAMVGLGTNSPRIPRGSSIWGSSRSLEGIWQEVSG